MIFKTYLITISETLLTLHIDLLDLAWLHILTESVMFRQFGITKNVSKLQLHKTVAQD